MDQTDIIEIELHKIHRKRNRLGYLPNVLSLIASVYFQREKLLTGNLWILACSLALTGAFIRVFVGEVLFPLWDKKVKWVRALNVFGFFLLGLGWGLHFMDVGLKFGLDSPNAYYTLLIISAFITISSTTLRADKVSYLTYIFTNVGVVSIAYLTGPGFAHGFIVLNIILFLLFSLSNYRLSYNQLMELIKSQIRISEDKDKLIDIIDTVPGFVGLIDRNMVCYMANQATLTIYPSIVGSRIGKLDPTSGWESYLENFITSQNKKSDIYEAHTTIGGEDIFALLNMQLMPDGGAIVVSIITTELAQAQKKLREQEAKAQYSAKLASIGEMAAGIAHEVNNPLTIIQGSAGIVNRLVQTDPIDIENVKLLTTKMMDTCQRISKTIKSIKALSRNGDNDPKEIFPLMNVINQCVDISQQRFTQFNISLKLLKVNPELMVFGREVQLSQVIINLINNSVDAVRNLKEKWIEIIVKDDESEITILIIDSGSGIPEEIQQRIMDPFLTTKGVGEGTGLGLSISKNIILDHEGDLTLEAKEAHTTFKIQLPLVKEELPVAQ